MAQVINRTSELHSIQLNSNPNAHYPQLFWKHHNGPVPEEYANSDQYHMAQFSINATRDKCVQIGSQIVVVKSLLK